MHFVQSLPSQVDDADQQCTSRPAKRAKIAGGRDAICVAREHVTVRAGEVSMSSDALPITRKNVGDVLALKLRSANPDDPAQGSWQLHLFSRTKSHGRGFAVRFPLADSDVSPELKTTLKVAEAQAFDPGDEGCLWATMDISVRQHHAALELELAFEVMWNERVTLLGSERSNSAPQQALRDRVLKTWYSDVDLHKATHDMPTSWSPQDFYEAACVPDKEALDREVSSMEIPTLQAQLYPFQRRAVQWLLRREGVHWCRSPGSNKSAVHPYVPPESPQPPISFTHVKDADGNGIYLSPLFGVATRDTSLFRSLQNFRGGILAEEMGLGKTLEIIALVLLHPRPDSPVMIFDEFLGRELLTTSATLIVTPSSLLDQWLSELDRHAPSLKVMFYPGIRKLAKLQGESQVSPERLAQYDVVVTTYEVLRTEIWAASDEPGRLLRREKQYERIRSPLVQLSWWRVCIDEAQMVENWTNNAAKLARRIPRINAWGITGTPVKDDVQKGKNCTSLSTLVSCLTDTAETDLRGLLLFLRYEPYASDAKVWNRLTTLDKASFRQLFHSISMRHSKSFVRNEIAIPPQKRYVITMPFTAVEEQHYQDLFEELAATCGLDAQGRPIQEDWDPEDPAVQSAMRVALDRLRQTVLHPEVGSRNRRALGQKAGPMRTVAEVLEAMLEQSEGAMRSDQRSLLSARLTRGQILARQKKVDDALSLWKEVLASSTEIVSECRAQLDRELQGSASEAQSSSASSEGDEDREDTVSPRVGEARRRLRSALEVQHRAVFFCANAYFSIKSNEEVTKPGSEDFKRLEKLEVEGYDQAKAIRKEILQEVRSVPGPDTCSFVV